MLNILFYSEMHHITELKWLATSNTLTSDECGLFWTGEEKPVYMCAHITRQPMALLVSALRAGELFGREDRLT